MHNAAMVQDDISTYQLVFLYAKFFCILWVKT